VFVLRPERIVVPLIPECSSCIIHSLIKLVPLLTDDADLQFEMMRIGMRYLAEGFEKRIRPHPLSVDLYHELYRMAGVEDPYAETKRESTEVALRILPEVDATVRSFSGLERLRAALAASIAGNLIDYNTAAHSPNLDTLVDDFNGILQHGIDVDDSPLLWQALRARHGHIVFVADNAGETILDIPLLRVIRDAGWHITYVVKGGPMANDATRRDIAGTEIEELATIADTGAAAHGVPPNLVSQEFLSLLSGADLVIAKGQSNVETLPTLQAQLGVVAFYVLRGKCDNIAHALGAKRGDNIVLRWPGE